MRGKDLTLPELRAQERETKKRLDQRSRELKLRLQPSRLIDDAVTDAKTRSFDLVMTAQQTARDRPGTAASAAAAVVLLLLRRPLMRLLHRLFGAQETATDPNVFKA